MIGKGNLPGFIGQNERGKLQKAQQCLTGYQRKLEKLKEELVVLNTCESEDSKRRKREIEAEIVKISSILNSWQRPVEEKLKEKPCCFVKKGGG